MGAILIVHLTGTDNKSHSKVTINVGFSCYWIIQESREDDKFLIFKE